MGLLRYLKTEMEKDIAKTGKARVNFSTIQRMGMSIDEFAKDANGAGNYEVEIDNKLGLVRIKK